MQRVISCLLLLIVMKAASATQSLSTESALQVVEAAVDAALAEPPRYSNEDRLFLEALGLVAQGEVARLHHFFERHRFNQHFNPHICDLQGRSLLLVAVEHGHTQTVAYLLQAGADPQQANAAGLTPLQLAIKKHHVAITLLLLKHLAKDVPATQTWLPLHYAAYMGDVALLEAFLADTDVNTVSGGVTALFLAANRGHTPAVTLLLQRQASVNLATSQGITPLMAAASGNHAGVVESLLLARASVNVAMQNGATALTLAAANGHAASVQLLLAARAQPNRLAGRYNALHLAALAGCAVSVEALLRYGANPLAVSRQGETAMALAAGRGHLAVVHVLLPHMQNLPVLQRAAVLQAAAATGQASVLAVLLETMPAGDLNPLNKAGLAALHLAAKGGHGAAVQVLLAHGANANCLSGEGKTALHYAAAAGDVRAVQALLDAKAEVNQLARQATPICLAALAGQQAVVTLLEQHGADPNLGRCASASNSVGTTAWLHASAEQL
jgi:ankyrin repeat protein